MVVPMNTSEHKYQQITCRYFKSGSCVRKDCPFSHELKKEACVFYHFKKSGCRQGKSCPFSHDILTNEQLKKYQTELSEYRSKYEKMILSKKTEKVQETVIDTMIMDSHETWDASLESNRLLMDSVNDNARYMNLEKPLWPLEKSSPKLSNSPLLNNDQLLMNDMTEEGEILESPHKKVIDSPHRAKLKSQMESPKRNESFKNSKRKRGSEQSWDHPSSPRRLDKRSFDQGSRRKSFGRNEKSEWKRMDSLNHGESDSMEPKSKSHDGWEKWTDSAKVSESQVSEWSEYIGSEKGQGSEWSEYMESVESKVEKEKTAKLKSTASQEISGSEWAQPIESDNATTQTPGSEWADYMETEKTISLSSNSEQAQHTKVDKIKKDAPSEWAQPIESDNLAAQTPGSEWADYMEPAKAINSTSNSERGQPDKLEKTEKTSVSEWAQPIESDNATTQTPGSEWADYMEIEKTITPSSNSEQAQHTKVVKAEKASEWSEYMEPEKVILPLSNFEQVQPTKMEKIKKDAVSEWAQPIESDNSTSQTPGSEWSEYMEPAKAINSKSNSHLAQPTKVDKIKKNVVSEWTQPIESDNSTAQTPGSEWSEYMEPERAKSFETERNQVTVESPKYIEKTKSSTPAIKKKSDSEWSQHIESENLSSQTPGSEWSQYKESAPQMKTFPPESTVLNPTSTKCNTENDSRKVNNETSEWSEWTESTTQNAGSEWAEWGAESLSTKTKNVGSNDKHTDKPNQEKKGQETISEWATESINNNNAEGSEWAEYMSTDSKSIDKKSQEPAKSVEYNRPNREVNRSERYSNESFRKDRNERISNESMSNDRNSSSNRHSNNNDFREPSSFENSPKDPKRRSRSPSQKREDIQSSQPWCADQPMEFINDPLNEWEDSTKEPTVSIELNSKEPLHQVNEGPTKDTERKNEFVNDPLNQWETEDSAKEPDAAFLNFTPSNPIVIPHLPPKEKPLPLRNATKQVLSFEDFL